MPKTINLAKLIPVVCGDLIRLGAPHDGGYVVTLAAVQRAKYLVSFGVSFDWSFERAFLRRNPSVTIHCYDHTVSGRRVAIYSLKNLVKLMFAPSKQRLLEALKYFSYRMFFTGRVHHHRNRVWYNHDSDSVTIRDVFERLTTRGEVFLKIDIEGSEYRVLDDVLEFSNRIDALAVEFHDIDIMTETFNDLLEKIRGDFYIVHVHANNTGGLSPDGFPNVLEITFQNRNLFDGEPLLSTRTYPVPDLDAPNVPSLPDLTLRLEG